VHDQTSGRGIAPDGQVCGNTRNGGFPMARVKLATTLICLSCMLSGCSTKYQDMGFMGGVTAQPVMTDVYRIVARGNGYTPKATVQDFVLLKAAETTLNAGGTHFVVLNESNQSKVEQTPATVNTTVYGDSAFTTYSRGSTFVKAGQDVMIRVLHLKPGESPPAGAFPAQDIAQTIGPRLKASSS
jgi:hypothetical protein